LSFAIGTIARVFGEMLVVKTALDSGKSLDLVGKDLNKKQWQLTKIVQSISRTDIRTLSYTLTQLYNADAKIKSYRGNPYRILEWSFYRICNYGRKA
jgi:DNA polymerase III delta subunit